MLQSITKTPAGKYTLYALGEILLVVIGILIALQVNNWNEERQVVQQAEIWRKAIINDLVFNKSQMNGRIEYNRQAMNFAEQALPLLKGSFPEDAETQWIMVLGAFQAGQIWPLQISGPTYREVQSRGSLSFIGSENTLQRLSDFYDVTAYDLDLVTGGKPIYRERIREVVPWTIQKYIWENDCQSDVAPIDQTEYLFGLEACGIPEQHLTELDEAARIIHGNQEIIELLQGRMSQIKISIDSFMRATEAVDAMLSSFEK